MTAGPLAGVTVIDLSRVLAGPYATMLLADLGARVVKIERPGSGDDSRAIGPFKNSADGTPMSAYFTAINRNKESLALDLKIPADRSIFESLLATADVLVENFRPGVMAKLGYSWESLHHRFPRLIYAAASGFGQTGPYAAKPAYDMVVQGMGGVMSITGHVGGPPTRVGTSFGDIVAGMFTALGVEAALLARAKTGAGQFVDVAMLDGQIAMLENAVVRYGVTGIAPEPLGARHPSITPFGAFKTADGHIILAAGNDELWLALCHVVGDASLAADPRYASNALRCDHHAPLTAALEAILQTAPTADWIARFEAGGVPCGPINTVAQALADPQVRARNMVVTTHFEDGTPLEVAGNPVKLSGHPDPATRAKAPYLDEHRADILAALADHSPRVPAAWVRLAHRLADASGIVCRRYFRTGLSADAKGDASPVTVADREAEQVIRALLASELPDHGIIGEEFGTTGTNHEWQWVIDPIDGTRAFLGGRPTFATLIALLHRGEPVLGVIDQPIVGDRWIGVAGQATLFNGMPCRTRACASLAAATISTTGPNYFSAQTGQAYERLRASCATSLWGGDGYAYGLLASGLCDAVVEAGLKLHDFAALMPIVTGAGGVMCDWQGAPLTAASDGAVVALGDPGLRASVLAVLGNR
jgi:CoA:oxalate CoA-transferase